VKPRTLVSWSSGKDSAWTLHLLRAAGEFEVAALFTTINQSFDRVAMHGVRSELLAQQARNLGAPLWSIPLPWPCPNFEYERLLRAACDRAVAEGIDAVAFGDLFLAEIRQYRESQLASTGLRPLFPLWQLPTRALALQMVRSGLRAKVVCLDPKQLDPRFLGRDFDETFLRDLPADVDPCGENGEFHTFAYDGPMFMEPIRVVQGEKVLRDGFWFCDLLPA